MKKNKQQNLLGRRRPLVKNLLLVDGISRAGKFLLTNILSGLDGIEPVQYNAVLEHVVRLRRFNLITIPAASELLHTEVDMACYGMLIGRNMNYRRSDKSSIFNNAKYKSYLSRLKEKDGSGVLDNFYGSGLYSLFIIHESLPNIKIFLDTFPQVKIIVIQRSPADLVYSWYKRKLGQRIGKDPLMGEIPLKGKKGPLPWYIYDHQEEYYSLSGINRVIFSISTLFKLYEAAYNVLSPKNKKNILFVRYEDILSEPEAVIKTLARFLGKKILPVMKQVIKKEKLPNKKHFALKAAKMEKIKGLAAEKYYKIIMSLEKRYFGTN
ncbi:hypothetical protein COT99_02375 [Candidatus Falkowbacteria bacterium CG10_big_fil_rev_8_21_14_0_10_43_10]|uniref:Sulfotransferase domain-containing protein n=1 Tax=Candidatus Falkowbacteria bacterium CG10_big_fil_rev_8_21_14_0_10_43_10 TaxID=1974567 RepID=A0A2H0V238_9BACT|nr:MAG: hypothetical protein COT99_02375 [Candidatus Falkowbacteria bacterium CG10_big_fil_rev_8_21_14_0_10_43_10]